MKAVEKMRVGDFAYGTMSRLIDNPGYVRISADSGLDFQIFDMEHGAYSMSDIADVLTVSRALPFTTFVRIPELSKAWVSRVLDAGADGIMLPMVETEAQAKQFVYWAKYTPLGNRGLAIGLGATGYKGQTEPTAYMAAENVDTLTIAQIETTTGVDNVEAIAATPGIDVLLIGPGDLSTSLGCPMQMDAPELHEAIDKVAKSATDYGKIFGMHAGLPLLESYVPKGLRMVSHASDVTMLAQALKSIHQKCVEISTG